MFNEDELKQLKLQYDAGRAMAQPQKQQVPKEQKKKKNFFLDQISTLGGIVGGIGGSFVAPLAGTAIGAGAGSALGEALENAITGESLGKNVAKEGVLGGVLGGGPLRLGGAAVSKIAPRAGQSIEQAGKNLLGTQANLTRAEARKIGANPGDVLGNINQRTGLTNMNKASDVAKNVTGENGVLSELTRNAIGNSRGVDIGDLRTIGNNLLTDKAPSVSGSVRKNVEEQIKNSVVKAYGGSQGSLSTLANPFDAFDVARTFESNASRLRSLPTPTSADQELASVYSGLAKEINTRLYNAPGVAEGIVQARPDAANAFRQLAQKAPSRSEKQAYERLAQETESLKDVQSIRSAQAPFVQLGKIDDASARAQAGAATQLGDNLQGLGRFTQRPTNIVSIPLNAATPTVGGALTRVGRNLQGAGSPQTATGIAGRVGAGGLIGALANTSAQQAPVEEPIGQQPAAAPMGNFPTQDPFGQQAPAAAIDPTEVRNNVQQILASGGDLDDAAKYLSLVETLNSLSAAPGSDLSANSAEKVAASSNATSTLDQLEGLFDNAGGGAGKVGGTLQNLLARGGINGDVQTYNDLANSSVTQVARALNGGGNVTDADAAVVIQALPKITDSPEVARAKFNALRERLLTARQNTLRYNGVAAPQQTIGV